MPDIPYSARVVALLILAAAMVLRDRRLRPESTDRMWEYGLLFGVGLVGVVFGAINDAITSTLSPDYFIIGKGLDPSGCITSQAIRLGAAAGFSATVVACAIWQFALRQIPARARATLIVRRVWIPCLTAALLALLLPFITTSADPLHFAARLKHALSHDEIARFRLVWWAHMGAYSGLIGGAIAGIITTRRSAGA